VLWLWWCITLGLAVNVGVQLLLARGDPLTLLQRELVTRLETVAQTLRRLAGQSVVVPERDSLRSLVTAGMSRPLALLKTAAVIHVWAHERHEALSAVITLTDRLVTSALALETLPDLPQEPRLHQRLLNVADGCERMRCAFNELRLPDDWIALADEKNTPPPLPLLDIERTLDQIALAVPRYSEELSHSDAAPAEKRTLFISDAFENPEYVRFAIKGTVAAFICYLVFIGFDYPGIYTSLITCFVVSLSTIGASNQKAILRFGGAAVGGLMGLVALVYLLPNVETIGGFWLVFGAGTAVAAWVNFGTPRISYGGYQVGLAFYKAVLQGFGPALSATVVRDRLIGVFFGLLVFGAVEHLLWPVRARDALRGRLAEILHLLADLARSGTHDRAPTVISADVDSWRRRISQKVEDIQTLIESSKFESGDLDIDDIQKRTGDGQLIFILLLSLARQSRDTSRLPDQIRAAAVDLDESVATALEQLAEHASGGSEPPVLAIDDPLNALERSVASTLAVDNEATAQFAGRLALYRSLSAAIKRLSLESLNAGHEGQENISSERKVFVASRETQTN
jgi:multidrug resistance protein MdtO